MFELEPARIPTAFAAVGMFTLSAWILFLRPSDRLHRALALFLFLRGLMEGLAAIQFTGPDYVPRLLVYAIIAMPFAALNLAVVFHDRYRLTSPWSRWGAPAGRWLILVGAFVVEAVYLLDHGSWSADGPGPLSLFLQLTPLSFALIALVFGLQSVWRSTLTTRHALALFACGFALFPAYDVTYHVALSLWGGIGTGPLDVLGFVIEVTSLGVLAWLIAAFAMNGLQRYAFATLIPPVTAVVAFLLVYRASPYSFATATSMAAVWIFGLVALTVYAVLKFQLFDIDLRVKVAVRNGAVTAGIAAVFFVVSEMIEQTVTFGTDVWTGIAVAGAIVLALRPLLRLAQRLADRLLPGVEDTAAYRDDRSRALYAAAVEGAYQDSEITSRERQVLERLRVELGLTEADAQLIEARTVVAGRAAGAPGALAAPDVLPAADETS